MVASPENANERRTVRRFIRWSTDQYRVNGIDSPRLTAEILLAHTLGTERIALLTNPDRPLTADACRRFEGLVHRRLSREPVAYITGTKEFWGLSLVTTPDVLIPRPDTERLVEAVLEVLPASAEKGRRRILDLGTGSGAIVVALASERPNHRYVATDRSLTALRVAETNTRRHHVDHIVSFFQGEWVAAVSERRPVFDVIISNPPYITDIEWPTLAPEVRCFEPEAALLGGADGLEAYRRILDDAWRRLRPGGYVFLEMGYQQRRDIEAVAAAVQRYEDVRCFADHSGHERVLRLRTLPA